MFSLNALSEAAQRERYADLIREAERERLCDATAKPGRRGAASIANARWRETLSRLRRPAAGRPAPAPAI